MARIRTVMVTTPAMLSDLITRLAQGRIDLDVVADFEVRSGLERNLRILRPDLVVIGLHAGETEAAIRPLLELLPTSKFVALSADGRTVFGYDFLLGRIALTDASPRALIDFLEGTSRRAI